MPPKLTYSPKTLNFGSSVLVGKTKPETLTIKNDVSAKRGTAALIEGVSNSDPRFKLINECPLAPAPLAPGKSCKISVTFEPSDGTLQSDTLTISNDTAEGTLKIPLTGTGKVPKVK